MQLIASHSTENNRKLTPFGCSTMCWDISLLMLLLASEDNTER